MKKSIQKPVNWQDFESLCKMLWGELWRIPMKIKKNGRNGQDQSGVDIYGIPKGESNFWGIQCKGKDDYSNAKLTTSEIDDEIAKAKKFKPKLEVFIFATTMNKDVKIEEYVRLKDIENRSEGSFEIQLFCWEEIADSIEENRDTYNFWIKNQQHISRHDFDVTFKANSDKEYTINPKWVKIIKRYRLIKHKNLGVNPVLEALMKTPNYIAVQDSRNLLNKLKKAHATPVSEATCEVEIDLKNIGAEAIDDWRVELNFKNEFIKVEINRPTNRMNFNYSAIPIRLGVKKNIVTYNSLRSESLIQKDTITIKLFITPELETNQIPIEWRMLARDYDTNGKLTLNVVHEFENKFLYEYVNSNEHFLLDEILEVKEKMTDDENLEGGD